MPTPKRRSFADMADAMLDAAAASPPPVTAAPTVRRSSSSRAPTAADVSAADDGPRLRASGEAARLAHGDIVRRTVYVGGEDWRAVLRLAMRRGVTASDVLRQALRDYLERGDGSTS